MGAQAHGAAGCPPDRGLRFFRPLPSIVLKKRQLDRQPPQIQQTLPLANRLGLRAASTTAICMPKGICQKTALCAGGQIERPGFCPLSPVGQIPLAPAPHGNRPKIQQGLRFQSGRHRSILCAPSPHWRCRHGLGPLLKIYRIAHLHIFAHNGDAHFALWIADLAHHIAPGL